MPALGTLISIVILLLSHRAQTSSCRQLSERGEIIGDTAGDELLSPRSSFLRNIRAYTRSQGGLVIFAFRFARVLCLTALFVLSGLSLLLFNRTHWPPWSIIIHDKNLPELGVLFTFVCPLFIIHLFFLRQNLSQVVYLDSRDTHPPSSFCRTRARTPDPSRQCYPSSNRLGVLVPRSVATLPNLSDCHPIRPLQGWSGASLVQNHTFSAYFDFYTDIHAKRMRFPYHKGSWSCGRGGFCRSQPSAGGVSILTIFLYIPR